MIMNNNRGTFAEFIAQKREACRITLRQMAEQLGVSAPYYSDVEKGRRNPLSMDKMAIFAKVTHMTEEEKNAMYDLAGQDRSEIAPDLPEYIKGRDYVCAALRTARDLGADQGDWDAFVAELKRRKG